MKKLKIICGKKVIAPVRSLRELESKANEDARYAELAITAARNLGGEAYNIRTAMNWLVLNAREVDEAGVVDEVNFCRDLVG